MKSIIRKPVVNNDGTMWLMDIAVDDIQIQNVSIMAIDGSTTTTGIGILRESDGALIYSCAFCREKGETPVQYKVRLKREVQKILLANSLIETVYYEEPFIGYATAAPNLMMLRTFIEEIIVEQEPGLNYLGHYEINNKRWKKLFLAPDKCPTGTDLEKAAVRDKMLKYLPFLSVITQDEIDAIAMGIVATTQIKLGLQEELASRKKPRPFKYNIKFIGADEDEYALEEFMEVYSGPKGILENGVRLTECKGTTNFDGHIFKEMGNEDKVLIVKFDSTKHGNVILEHRIGGLAVSYDYIYAIVWRQSRRG